MPRIENIFQQRWYTQTHTTGDLSVDLLRIPLLEIVLQLRKDLENDVNPGKSKVSRRKARVRKTHIDVAWRALVVVDDMD